MNEALIKKLVKYKLDAAGAVIDCLPSKISEEIKDLSRIILEGINEGSKGMKKQTSKKGRTSDKLNNVPIE